MFATTVIVFREVLEAALIIGIVMAAVRGAPGRGIWVGGGLVAGLVAASLVAGFADVLAGAASGLGQEWFNAIVLFVAVAMLGWHNIWMKRHGRELSARMQSLGRDVGEGTRPMYAIAVVICLAVLREGAEVVLFLYGIAAGESGAAPMLTGGLLGVLLGVAVGWGLYQGLLRVPLRHLFRVTGWLILVLAAGLSAQGAGFLEQAGVLPPLGVAIWDSSAILTEYSVVGKLLHTLIGYMAQPDGIQIVFYVVTLMVIGGMMHLADRPSNGARSLPLAIGMFGALSISVLLLVASRPLFAG